MVYRANSESFLNNKARSSAADERVNEADSLLRRKGLVQRPFSGAGRTSGGARELRKAKGNLISGREVFGRGKEGGRGLWFVVRMEASRSRGAGVETDFLALYAHALGKPGTRVGHTEERGAPTQRFSASCKRGRKCRVLQTWAVEKRVELMRREGAEARARSR